MKNQLNLPKKLSKMPKFPRENWPNIYRLKTLKNHTSTKNTWSNVKKTGRKILIIRWPQKNTNKLSKSLKFSVKNMTI
jgi:hypothetical protein